MRQAAGFIEMRGLTAAITAADIALKAANVELIGLELTRGMGYAVVKIQGDVGAVKAAVDAATSAPETVNYFVAKDVIARPSKDLDKLMYTEETQGLKKEEAKPKETEESKEQEEVKAQEADASEEVSEETKDSEEKEEAAPSTDQSLDEKEEGEITCNLCLDPECPRHKGEPRVECIHFAEIVENK